MSWREKIIDVVDVVIRIPPLFVMDAVLNNFNNLAETNEESDAVGNSSLLISVLPILLSILVLVFASLVFVLTTAFLLNVYCTLLTISIVGISYHWNQEFISKHLGSEESDVDSDFTYRLLENVIFQGSLAYMFIGLTDNLLPRATIFMSFLLPSTICCVVPLRDYVIYSPILSSIIPTLQLFVMFSFNISRLSTKARLTITWLKMIIQNYGLHLFLENQWQRLQVPVVLRCFFMCRVVEQAGYLLSDMFYTTNLTSSEVDSLAGVIISPHQVVDVIRTLMVRGCETLVALMGMTSWLSSLSHYLIHLVQLFLDNEDAEDRSISSISAILFFILAIQTGLTGMPPNLRIERLYKNVCLLVTAILHFIHTLVNPLLMALSASHNRSWGKHARALTVCLLLIILPTVFIYYLWQYNRLTTWLFAVSAFCVEVIIKVCVTLMLYALFLIDAYRETFWEELDDYIHYVKSLGNTIEFIFGIVLFCNGLFIMLFEQGGTVRAIMMCIHAYFNIWMQAKEGWKIFMKRRTAVNKINTLPEANEEELRAHNDVCAICFQELRTARITRCNHYYHAMCLRKWLYVQDKCPLCQEVLYNRDEQANHGQTPQQPQHNNQQLEHREPHELRVR